jgi:hypothetical protein
MYRRLSSARLGAQQLPALSDAQDSRHAVQSKQVVAAS